MGQSRRWASLMFLLAICIMAGAAEGQVTQDADRTGRIVVGAGLGLEGGTADATVFGLGANADYYLTNGFSLGPLLQLGLGGDLFQLGLTLQAKYTFDIPDLRAFKPHVEAGIGFIYSDFEPRSGGSERETSYLFPIGFGLEYQLSRRLSLDTTFFFNLTDLTFDQVHATWLVGVRMPF